MSTDFVPEGFTPPDGLIAEAFVLEPLGPEHNEADHAAWMSSIDHIHASPGFVDDFDDDPDPWPRPMTLEQILSDLHTSKGLRKKLLLAVVDEEGDVTYYDVGAANPKGRQKKKQEAGQIEGLFTGDRVIVNDPRAAEIFQEDYFYGKLLGDRLQLSLIEAAYLIENGLLLLKSAKTGRKLDSEQLKKHGRKIQRDFDLRLRVYDDLKNRGLVVKTGFKYGSHFRAYEGNPNRMHARFLVHAVPKGYSTIWPEISRAVRLSHGVRKEILFGEVGKGGIEYLRLSRCRP